MVTLSSFSNADSSLYLEIRSIDLRGEQENLLYHINGMVGDGCDEAFIRAQLGEPSLVEIVSICNEDGTGGLLEQRIDRFELSRLILETLGQLYFCIDSPPRRKSPGRVIGYADRGQLYRLRTVQAKPHLGPTVAERGSHWQAA